MYKCLFGSEESKAAGLEALPAATQRYMSGLNRRLPESGFVHGRDIPSLADLAVYNLVTSKFPGLRAMKQDLSAFPRVLSTVKSVENVFNPPVIIHYFNHPGRGTPSEMALRIGGVNWVDSRSGVDFQFSDIKKQPKSFIW